VGAFDGIVPDPAPPHCLGEGGTQHDVHASQRAGRQRTAADPAATAEHGVGGVDHRRGDVPDRDVPQGKGGDSGRAPSGFGGLSSAPSRWRRWQTGLEQLAHSRAHPDSAYSLHGRDHRGEFAFGVGAGATNRGGAVQTVAGDRVGSDVDAQFPGAGASLT
jgi:hypothetical protein